MPTRYVGNLGSSVISRDLSGAFFHGEEVLSAPWQISDRLSGLGCGFGFVEMRSLRRSRRIRSSEQQRAEPESASSLNRR
jgi:hypothetical protein